MSLYSKNSFLTGLTGLMLVTFFFAPSAFPFPEYAEQTGKDCSVCHAGSTGGQLTKLGEDFREELRIRGEYRSLRPFQKVIRLGIGYLHLLTAIAWFGTIFYVHLILKPAYAAKGLPKGELILGWSGIAILSVTGVLLTISRIPTWHTLYTTRFGVLLSAKIILFLIMVATAFMVTFYIGPKLRAQKHSHLPRGLTRFTLQDLSHCDGKEGRPAYFAYQGKIYDAGASHLWKDGSHMRRHFAGNDLTEALKAAPHGEDKVFQVPQVGELVSGPDSEERPLVQKVFYLMAYMNLIFVFLITFIIALWRWW